MTCTSVIRDAPRPAGLVAVNKPVSVADGALLDEVVSGLSEDQFEVWYQPIVRPGTGEVTKVEALVRWRHPERGLLLPGSFLAAVERSPLIADLDAHVLRTACRQVAAWRAGPAPHLELAVNLSAVELDDERLVSRVADALAASGLAPHALWLEVTETAFSTDSLAAIAGLERLRQLGVRLTLDDFGTGFAHLVQLRRLPVQALKIDRSFVAGMSTEAGDAAIVRSVLTLGRELGLTVVAEGVETEEQRRVLVELRCDLAQGYLFGQPTPADQVRLDTCPAPATAPAGGGLADRPDPVEQARLEALRSCAILDTPAEHAFDHLVALAAQLCDAPIALVTLVDAHRQWFKARVGVEADETPRQWAFCHHAVMGATRLVVPDATADRRFADNPLVTGDPKIRSYAGVPLVLADGAAIGTLCVIDQRTRQFGDDQLRQLEDLADQVTALLELRRALARLEEERRELERARAELHDRERFLRAIVDSTPDIICRLTPEGVIDMLSDSARRLLGVEPSTLLGRSALDLIHPDDLPRAVASLAETVTSLGPAAPTELRLRHGAGHWLPFELIGNTVEEHDGQRRLVVTGRDLAARRRAETELQAGRAFIDAVLDGIDDGVVACAADGTITYHNRAATVASTAAADRLLRAAVRDGEITDDLVVADDERGEVRLECRARRLTAPDGSPLGAVMTMRDVTAHRAAQAALHAFAYSDPLTGLANRRSFTEAINRPGVTGVIYIDLDDFKAVNDIHGHDVGDRLLEVVARRLEASCRRVDVAARLGGDEFGIVTTTPDLAALARRLAEAVARPIELGHLRFRIAASIGFAPIGEGTRDLDPVQAADHRMLEAKRAKKLAQRA